MKSRLSKILPGLLPALLLILTLVPMAWSMEQDEVSRILDHLDRLFRSNTSYSVMEMRIETPDWQRTLRLEAWTEGLEKTFVHILSPKKEAGTATLRMDNEMWNYFPKINKVMKVPPSMMMSSWMGSDFTNDDLVKESSMKRDYEGTMITPPDADEDYYYIQLIPKEDSPIVWGRIVAKIRKSDYIPVLQEFYDERGTLMRTMELKEIRNLGGKIIPTVMILTPLNKKGNRTIVTYESATFDSKLDKDVFSLRNLQRRR